MKSTNYIIELSSFAEDDLKSSFEFYQNKSNLLAKGFIPQINKLFDKIAHSPFIYSPLHGNIRKANVAKYPFVIYFRIDSYRIEVLAIFHSRRNPNTLIAKSIPREILEE